jgi:hypothetical protein
VSGEDISDSSTQAWVFSPVSDHGYVYGHCARNCAFCHVRPPGTWRWIGQIGLALVAVAGCTGAPVEQGRYTGIVSDCGEPQPATLVRMGDRFVFTPGDGAIVLRGQVAIGGVLAATLNTQPPGKPPYLVTLTGRMDDRTAELWYATPRCTSHGRLTRVTG